MEYSKVKYLVNNELFYYEITEDNRSMCRMVILYPDNTFNIASVDWNIQYLETSYEAGCSTIQELNTDPCFEAEYIVKEEFEKVWNKYLPKINSHIHRIE